MRPVSQIDCGRLFSHQPLYIFIGQGTISSASLLSHSLDYLPVPATLVCSTEISATLGDKFKGFKRHRTPRLLGRGKEHSHPFVTTLTTISPSSHSRSSILSCVSHQIFPALLFVPSPVTLLNHPQSVKPYWYCEGGRGYRVDGRRKEHRFPTAPYSPMAFAVCSYWIRQLQCSLILYILAHIDFPRHFVLRGGCDSWLDQTPSPYPFLSLHTFFPSTVLAFGYRLGCRKFQPFSQYMVL